ncbi:MAG: DNA polymerase III subunit beta, partial [Deltaproteobacteria bacterium]|nr:DNA polymerase III subunit beta [Deltaproteobacteria bacterium]
AELPEEGLLLPKKGLNEINKFLDIKGPVRVGIEHNHFVLKKEAETIIARLLEGDFPDYTEIIHREGGNIIEIDKFQFFMMLKRMSILSSEDYKAAIFNFEKERILISASNPDLGESKEDMDITFEGDHLTIAFNPKYFMDAINIIESDTVLLYIADEERPCLLLDKQDDSFVSAIMPMRI